MGTERYSLDGVSLMLVEGLSRQQVYWDGELVSERSTLWPRWTRVHTFTSGSPPAAFELRAGAFGGWLLIRDGLLVGSKRPGWGFPALFGAMGVINLIEFASEGGAWDGFAGGLFTLFGASGLLAYWGWRRATRRWPAAPTPGRVEQLP